MGTRMSASTRTENRQPSPGRSLVPPIKETCGEPRPIIERLFISEPLRYGSSGLGAGRMTAADNRQERKVRAPEDRVVGNADRPQGSGKCNRKQTAVATRAPVKKGRRGKGETVR